MKIQVVIEQDEYHVEDVQRIAYQRRGPFTPEELGSKMKKSD